MRARFAAIGSIALLAWIGTPPSVQSQNAAQPQITTITLGPDQIGVLKTGPAISTRVSFRERVQDIVCGDLYDPGSGTGAFVIQRIDNDVFIKPVAAKGISNMFVKTGENRENTYNFSLMIVPIDEAYRIVNVVNVLAKMDPPRKVVRPSAVLRVSPPSIQRVSATNDAEMVDAPGSKYQTLFFEAPRNPGFEMPPSPPSAYPKREVARAFARQIVKRVAAYRSEHAKFEGVMGDVVVEVTIDDSGKVTSARALSGPPMLRGAAVVAAKFWKFSAVSSGDEIKQDLARIKFSFEGSGGETASYLKWVGDANKKDRRP